MKLTISYLADLAEQKPVVIFLRSEACVAPLASEVIFFSLNINKALRPKASFRVTWRTYIKLDDPVH